jgi:hypothetical protein
MSRKPIEKGKHWTDKDKLKVIAAFSVLGNATKVEEVTGVPSNTINYWKTLPWWFEEMEKLRRSEDDAMISGYGKIMKKTIEKLEERIDNGDMVILRDGSTVMKPIPAKDLAHISTAATNARQKIRGEGLDNQIKTLTVQERLQQLSEKFMSFTKNITIDGEILSKEIVDEKVLGEEGTQEGRDEGIQTLEIQAQDGREEGTQGEVLNAVQDLQASEDDGSGSPQSSLRKEGGDSPEGSTGFQPS